MTQIHRTGSKTLAEMVAECRQINIEKGFRPAGGGPGSKTFGDYIALLHSEVSESLEAFRVHGLEDATVTPDRKNGDGDPEGGPTSADPPLPKPEGVGSEFADVLIRLIDMCDVFGIEPFDMDMEIGDIAAAPPPRGVNTFGDYTAWLHFQIAMIGFSFHEDPGLAYRYSVPFVLRALVTTAGQFGIDLTAEYERKLAFNRTRAFMHGNKTF